jgi:predicted MFS family arabinose efflux permease
VPEPPTGPVGRIPGRFRATALLTALRFGYAYNWFDVGPALPRIGATFGVGATAWGFLVGGFLLGAGALQVPAGQLARRTGERPVVLAGAGILAAASLAGAFAPSYAALLASRIVAGAGAGLFFSPAIGWVGRLYARGERGVPVGTFSSAFSGGAAAGVFGSALLAPLLGWRDDLALGAIGLAGLAALAAAAIPAGAGGHRPVPPTSGTGGASWRGRSVIAIGLAFVGFEGASFATGQFIVPFGELLRLWPAWLAGAVGTAFVLPSVVGGPAGGWLAERSPRPRTQMAVATLLAAIALATLPFDGVAAAILVGSVFSFGYGAVYAVMYVLPHSWADLPPADLPLAIGLFNAIQLGGGALVSAAFGRIVAVYSYDVGWEVLAAVQAAALVCLLFVRPTSAARRPDAAAVVRP